MLFFLKEMLSKNRKYQNSRDLESKHLPLNCSLQEIYWQNFQTLFSYRILLFSQLFLDLKEFAICTECFFYVLQNFENIIIVVSCTKSFAKIYCKNSIIPEKEKYMQFSQFENNFGHKNVYEGTEEKQLAIKYLNIKLYISLYSTINIIKITLKVVVHIF